MALGDVDGQLSGHSALAAKERLWPIRRLLSRYLTVVASVSGGMSVPDDLVSVSVVVILHDPVSVNDAVNVMPDA